MFIKNAFKTTIMTPKYTSEYIKKSGITEHIQEAISIEGFCRVVLNNAEIIKNSTLLRVIR